MKFEDLLKDYIVNRIEQSANSCKILEFHYHNNLGGINTGGGYIVNYEKTENNITNYGSAEIRLFALFQFTIGILSEYFEEKKEIPTSEGMGVYKPFDVKKDIEDSIIT